MINISSRTQEKKVQQVKSLEFFLLDTLETTFLGKKLNPKMNTRKGVFFLKSGYVFRFSKRRNETIIQTGLICKTIPL